MQYNRAAVEASFASGVEVDEDGLEDAFELVAEVPEKIRCGGVWPALAQPAHGCWFSASADGKTARVACPKASGLHYGNVVCRWRAHEGTSRMLQLQRQTHDHAQGWCGTYARCYLSALTAHDHRYP